MGNLVSEMSPYDVISTLELMGVLGANKHHLINFRIIGNSPHGEAIVRAFCEKIEYYCEIRRNSIHRKLKLFHGEIPIKKFFGSEVHLVDKGRETVFDTADFLALSLQTYPSPFRDDEESITGEEMLIRTKKTRDFHFNTTVFYSLWLDYCDCLAEGKQRESFLEWMKILADVKIIRFPGDIYVNDLGQRMTLGLENDGKYWQTKVYSLASPVYKKDYRNNVEVHLS